MTEIQNIPLLLLILLLAGLYTFSGRLLMHALHPEAARSAHWWLAFGLCLCGLFLIMAVFNIPLPLFFLLLYGLKICEFLHFPDASRQNWIGANEGFLFTCATGLIVLGVLSFAFGINVRVLLHAPLLRCASLVVLLLCNLATNLFLSSRPGSLLLFSGLNSSEESRLFTQFTFLAVVFVLADASACLFDLPTTLVSLFLVGSNALLMMMIGFFLNQINIIRQEDYLEYEHTLLTSTMHQQTARTDALRDSAYRDPLTGAYTRLYILDYLELLLSRGDAFALAYIDLDGLKAINDACGHLAGDQYLQDFSERFAAALRSEDVFARVGGDEFMVLLPDTPAAAARALLVAARGRLAASRSPDWSLSFSFGIAESPAGAGKSRESLIQEADQSMYQDKSTRHKKEVR